MKPRSPFPCRAGLSQVDLLVSVAGIALVSGIAVEVVTSITANAARVKLIQDVKHLNAAVSMYRANGGNVADLSDAKSVLNRLKQTRSRSERRQFVGAASGRLVDPRLRVEFLPEGEVDSNRERGYWSQPDLAFKTTREPIQGIKRFRLGEAPSLNEMDDSEADSIFSYASKGNWIWDYVEATPQPIEGPTSFATEPAPSSTTPPLSVHDPPPSEPLPPEAPAPPASDRDPSGGIALNVGSGNATADDGIALNLLSDDVSAEDGEIALGALGLGISLGGDGNSDVSGVELVPPGDGATDHASTLGGSTGIVAADDGTIANIGEGESAASDGISANVGEGSSEARDGVSANAGSGSSSANDGISGNLGTGSSSADNGLGLNLGSGSAEAGSSGD